MHRRATWTVVLLVMGSAACGTPSDELAAAAEGAEPRALVGLSGLPASDLAFIPARSASKTLDEFLVEEARAPRSRHKVAPRASDRLITPALAGEDWFTLDECREWADDLGLGQWYYKNHFSACRVEYFEYEFRENCPSPCTLIGRQRFRITIIGSGFHQERSLDWAIVLDDWKTPTGRTNPNAPLRVEVKCNAFGLGDCDQTAGESKTLAQWRQFGRYEQYGSPDFISAAPGDEHPEERRTRLEYTPTFNSQIEQTTEPTAVRCDTAEYVGLNGGCIFTRTDGVFMMDLNDPTYGESARFIETAFYNIRALHRGVGLFVPGNPQPDSDDQLVPLTRNYHGNQAREKIRAECRTLYGDDFRTDPNVCDNPPCDCDEYPFATTYQNANYDEPGTATTYVVKPVNFDQNQAAGRNLGQFMTADHLLDGDRFWVYLYGDDD